MYVRSSGHSPASLAPTRLIRVARLQNEVGTILF